MNQLFYKKGKFHFPYVVGFAFFLLAIIGTAVKYGFAICGYDVAISDTFILGLWINGSLYMGVYYKFGNRPDKTQE